jgi:hypothetical protein
MRLRALGPAIRAGRLDIVRYILDLGWGLIDLVDNPVRQEDMVEGMLRNKHIDFSSQVIDLLRSCSTPQQPLVDLEPDINRLLDGIAAGSPQRADVAAWLLSRGATIQTPQEPQQRVDTRAPNAPVQAVQGVPTVHSMAIVQTVATVRTDIRIRAVPVTATSPAVQDTKSKEDPLPANPLRRANIGGNEKNRTSAT